MSRNDWSSLVRALEVQAHASPRKYRAKVLWLAVVGYGVLALLIGATTGVFLWLLSDALNNGLGELAGAKLYQLLLFGVLTVSLLWCLRVSIPEPQGIEITREEAPRLFRLIDKIREKVEGPPIHRVIIDDSYNAGVAQCPQLGLLGVYRNHLVLGLPYLLLNPPGYVVATLAHEYGHLSGRHGRFGSWIYRLRRHWEQLAEHTTVNVLAWPVQFFFSRYVPYFNAVTFVLAREQEYEADQISAKVVGRRLAGASLAWDEVHSRFLQHRFWPKVMQRAMREPVPDEVRPYSMLWASRRGGLQPEQAQEWFDEALNEHTDVDDTHPRLRDRLEALRAELALTAEPPGGSAAQVLLGRTLAGLLRRFDEQWQHHVAPEWRDRHERARQETAELASLRRPDIQLTHAQLRRLAELTEEWEGTQPALALYRRCAESTPADAASRFAVARILLEAGDEEGLYWLERAREADEETTPYACYLAERFFRGRRLERGAKLWADRADEWDRLEQAAWQERVNIDEEDRFAAHELADRQIEAILAEWEDVDQAHRIWLLRKQTRVLPRRPFYVVVVERVRSASPERLLDALSCNEQLPGQFMVVLAEGQLEWLGERARNCPGALIHG